MRNTTLVFCGFPWGLTEIWTHLPWFWGQCMNNPPSWGRSCYMDIPWALPLLSFPKTWIIQGLGSLIPSVFSCLSYLQFSPWASHTGSPYEGQMSECWYLIEFTSPFHMVPQWPSVFGEFYLLILFNGPVCVGDTTKKKGSKINSVLLLPPSLSPSLPPSFCSLPHPWVCTCMSISFQTLLRG